MRRTGETCNETRIKNKTMERVGGKKNRKYQVQKKGKNRNYK